MSCRFMSFSFLTWKMGMMVFILPILHNYKKFIHSFFSPRSEFGKIYKLQNAVMWEAGLLFHGHSPNRTGRVWGSEERGQGETRNLPAGPAS